MRQRLADLGLIAELVGATLGDAEFDNAIVGRVGLTMQHEYGCAGLDAEDLGRLGVGGIGGQRLLGAYHRDAELFDEWHAKRGEVIALRAKRVELASQLVPDAETIRGFDLRIEEVEGEIQTAKAQKMDIAKAEAKIKEARKLFETDGNYAAARLAAAKARALLVAP